MIWQMCFGLPESDCSSLCCNPERQLQYWKQEIFDMIRSLNIILNLVGAIHARGKVQWWTFLTSGEKTHLLRRSTYFYHQWAPPKRLTIQKPPKNPYTKMFKHRRPFKNPFNNPRSHLSNPFSLQKNIFASAFAKSACLQASCGLPNGQQPMQPMPQGMAYCPQIHQAAQRSRGGFAKRDGRWRFLPFFSRAIIIERVFFFQKWKWVKSEGFQCVFVFENVFLNENNGI